MIRKVTFEPASVDKIIELYESDIEPDDEAILFFGSDFEQKYQIYVSDSDPSLPYVSYKIIDDKVIILINEAHEYYTFQIDNSSDDTMTITQYYMNCVFDVISEIHVMKITDETKPNDIRIKKDALLEAFARSYS